MNTTTLFLLFVVLLNVAQSFGVNEIGMVDQSELFQADDEINAKPKGLCSVHKSTGIWQCIINCVIVIDEEDIQIRQHRFKSCIVAKAMMKHMERNPFMAKHINLKFKQRRTNDDN